MFLIALPSPVAYSVGNKNQIFQIENNIFFFFLKFFLNLAQHVGVFGSTLSKPKLKHVFGFSAQHYVL